MKSSKDEFTVYAIKSFIEKYAKKMPVIQMADYYFKEVKKV